MLRDIFTNVRRVRFMPTLAYSWECRATAFRLFSRVGCLIEELKCQPQRCEPTACFEILVNKDAAARILAKPECVRGLWLNEQLTLHPTLLDEEFLAKLENIAMSAWGSIGLTESRWASVRRLLEARSLQTHRQRFDDLSGEWTMQQARRPSPLSLTDPKPDAETKALRGRKRKTKSRKRKQPEPEDKEDGARKKRRRLSYLRLAS